MPAYLITIPCNERTALKNSVNTMVIFAKDAADCQAIAQAKLGNDSNAAWAAAVPVEVVAGASLVNYRLRVCLQHPTTHAVVYNTTVTGAAAATIDTLGAAAAVALVAAGAANAAYNAGAHTLTVTAIADGLGDHVLTVELLPPLTWDNYTTPIPGFVGAITDEGIAAADVTVVLDATGVVPNVAAELEMH